MDDTVDLFDLAEFLIFVCKQNCVSVSALELRCLRAYKFYFQQHTGGMRKEGGRVVMGLTG
jgi:hypothetical protein